jgi:DNA topoisomerase-1
VGPYGPYLELGDEGNGEKPKRVSLPQGKVLEEVDLDYARRLLSLPRTLGVDPVSGETVTVGLGKYGPFVRMGQTFASLPGEEHLFTVELDEALRLLGEKQAGKRILKELGPHPESGGSLQVIDGRFGPYVTDGKLNATLPKTMDPEEVDLDAAVELLARAAKRKGRGRGKAVRGKKRG